MENEKNFIYRKKVLIFGTDAVGKSTLISAISKNDIEDEKNLEDSNW